MIVMIIIDVNSPINIFSFFCDKAAFSYLSELIFASLQIILGTCLKKNCYDRRSFIFELMSVLPFFESSFYCVSRNRFFEFGADCIRCVANFVNNTEIFLPAEKYRPGKKIVFRLCLAIIFRFFFHEVIKSFATVCYVLVQAEGKATLNNSCIVREKSILLKCSIWKKNGTKK